MKEMLRAWYMQSGDGQGEDDWDKDDVGAEVDGIRERPQQSHRPGSCLSVPLSPRAKCTRCFHLPKGLPV